jgi:hypothetical protein
MSKEGERRPKPNVISIALSQPLAGKGGRNSRGLRDATDE